MKKDNVKSSEKHHNHADHASHASTDEGNGQPETNAVASSITRDELIRQTAYSQYEARSHTHGQDLDDWYQAETKVNQMS
jgi:hypothetical protein